MHWTSSQAHGQAARKRGTVRLGRLLLSVLLGTCVPGAAAQESQRPGGPQLHLDCRGRGSPTVVLDAGLGGSSLEWFHVVERLRGITQVCTYDRAGYGMSAMGAPPRTSSHIANELYLLLGESELQPPYILAGHSFGGYNMQLFARRYPYLSAGLVLVDASHPDQVDRFLAPPIRMLTAPSSRYGVVRFSEPPPPHEMLPDAIRQEIRARAGRWKTRRTLGNELLGFRDSALELKAAPPLGQMPLVVITRGLPRGPAEPRRPLIEQLWLELQSELAAASTVSAHLVARRAGHHVHVEQPGLVAFGIALLVERHRRQRGVGVNAFISGAAARFPVEDATWLRDTLALHPAGGTPRMVASPTVGEAVAGPSPDGAP